MLRSGRGPEFTGKVVEAVNKTLGVEHAFGAAYHPQSQGYIEGRHKTINQVLAAYAGDNPGQWARRAKLAQWAMRATPRSDRDGKSPYEIVTGLKPQGPLNAVFERVRPINQSITEYVTELNRSLSGIRDGVAAAISADFEKRQFAKEHDPKATSGWLPNVGDTVLLRRPPVGPPNEKVSTRLLPRASLKA